MTKPWHGLPVWAWVVGGTVVAYLVWTKVLHKSSSSASSVPSGAVGTTAPAGGGKVHESFPTGGSYTGPASSAPGYPKPTPGKSLGTAPAPTTTTSATTPKPTPIAGTYQRAPSYTPHRATGKTYTPIKTWAQTLALASKGITVYLWTAANGRPVPTSLAELKALEHTGTHAYPQFTTYTTTTGGGPSTMARIALPTTSTGTPSWTPAGQLPATKTTVHVLRHHSTGSSFIQTERYTPVVKRNVIVSG
ncbi:MAG: hypothetical protein M0Z46_10495 [Actinomycetota bacterium]|nr:hypothetical protein [Actinomycetota bacterium]